MTKNCYFQRLRRTYFTVGEYNILTVDWEPLALSPWYNSACKNTEVVGRKTAQFVSWLVAEMGVSYGDVHVLGSSLGAQAAGYVGHFTGGALGRITGLDPSGPLFYSVGSRDRLDRSDAQFVDIIHTAGYWVGSSLATGHTDFYPNKGLAPQPGCEDSESLDLSCSHFTAWRLYIQSVRRIKERSLPPLLAIQCRSYQAFQSGQCCHNTQPVLAQLGELVDRRARGVFYLSTGPQGSYNLPVNTATNCDLAQKHVNISDY